MLRIIMSPDYQKMHLVTDIGIANLLMLKSYAQMLCEISFLTHTNSCGKHRLSIKLKYGRTGPENEESEYVLVLTRLLRWTETSMNFYSNLLPNLQEAGAHEQALVQADDAWSTTI
ncbi:hypothetical protein PIB30_030934 [Stylosanthes scabra]|uniref:Uncharacterized protein n=1 Tax=Stylosanthes scabra TaxID=79078 RepID=A0ABU6QB82_9FABA|nr:hypothetical protein [Stylosanthes scabra]